MKKSLHNKLYKSTIILLAVFILSIIVVNSILSYNNFLAQKEEIQEDIINSKKEIMRSQVDFMITDIENEKAKSFKQIKKSLKTRVDTAKNIAQNLYNTHKDDPHIQNIVVEALRQLKFYDIGSQYVFMTKLDGTFLLVDSLKHLEGKNVFELTTDENKKTLNEVIDFIQTKKSGFYEYFWQDHETLKFEKKLSYFVYFEPFDCYIGTGLFVKDIDQRLKDKFIERLDNYRYGIKMGSYIFVTSYEGISLTYPAKNKYIYDLEDKNGVKIVQELIEIAKKGGGYLNYVLPSGYGKDQNLDKIGYVRGLNDWNVYIGTGETLNNIDSLIEDERERLSKDLLSDLIVIVFFGLAFFIVFYILFKKIKFSIANDIDTLTRSIEKLVTKNERIDRNKIVSKEFDKIALHANQMIDTKEEMEKELKNKELILHQQAKMAAMGDMLENIAHQWRQPLSVITVATTGIQLKKQFGKLDDEYMNKSLNSIYENAKYLSTTIDDFRSFFLSDKKSDVFMIDEVLDKSLKLVESKFKNRDIEVIRDIENFEIENYKNELIQVLLIILNNAKDALEDIEAPKYIFINMYKKDDFFYMEFKDNANGIKEKNLEKIFEPYFTTKHQSQGTGIGLYMVQEIIIKHMKGEVNAENCSFEYEKNKYYGAKFNFKIPIKI